MHWGVRPFRRKWWWAKVGGLGIGGDSHRQVEAAGAERAFFKTGARGSRWSMMVGRRRVI